MRAEKLLIGPELTKERWTWRSPHGGELHGLPNGLPFGSKSKGKLLLRSCPIQCEKNWKFSFFSVATKRPVQNQPQIYKYIAFWIQINRNIVNT